MIRKNTVSTTYINSSINRSPSKETHTFGRQERFVPKKIFSPDKIYDLPDSRQKRATTFGLGNRTEFLVPNMSEPANYHLKSEFDEISQGYRFGLRPDARTSLNRDASVGKLRKINVSPYLQRNQAQRKKSVSKSKRVSPSPNRYDKRRDESQKQRGKSVLQQNDPNRQKKSAYRLKFEYSQNYLLGNNHTSFLNNKEQHPPINHSISTFPREERMRNQTQYPNLGPGSYNAFSEFGDNNRPF